MGKATEILPQVLADMDKESLIEIIIRQGGELQDLRQQREELQKRIEQLERANKRPAAPFRIEDKKRKDKKKKAGARKGHSGHYRKLSGKIDAHQEVLLSDCPSCGGKVADSKPVKQIIEELVLRPFRLELTTYQGKCENCGIVHSTHPFQTSHAVGSAGCHLGKQATATALLLNHRYGMSKRKVCALFTDHFQLPLSIGGLVQMQHRMADGFASEYESLQAQAQASEVLHSDETSWYIGEPKGWLWTFTNEDFTFYRVDESRKREVVREVIGEEYQGVLVSDCLVVYDDICEKQQKCYAHHLKAISQALQTEPDSEYLKDWQQLLQKAIDWKEKQNSLTADAYQDGCIDLAMRATELLKKPRASPAEEKIGNRMEKQADHLFTFLRHEQVAATNNRAERSLRPAVIHRKISCGNKTRKGADTWQILASVITTTEQQNSMSFSKKVQAVINHRLQR